MENDTSPAEELYKTVRKVNWDGINGLTRSIGKQGESLVLELEKHYLRAIGRDDLASQVTYVEDGKGYDVLSYSSDGHEKYIEVKTTTRDILAAYFLSRRELLFLARHREDAFIYRVVIGKHDGSSRLRVYSFSEVIQTGMLADKFRVKHPA